MFAEERSSYRAPSQMIEATFPAVKSLTRRQKELLTLKGIPIPDTEFRVVDLSQNLAFANVVSGKMPCVTPDGAKYLSQQCRFATGTEYLRFQGIWMDEPALSRYSSSFLQDLAGNAYETTTCGANLLCAMVFLACNFKCGLASSTIPQQPCSDSSSDDEAENNLDGLWNFQSKHVSKA